MARRLKEQIICTDSEGTEYEVLLFQIVVPRRNTKGEVVEQLGRITACLSDKSAVVQTGPDTFRIVWNGKEIKRLPVLSEQ